MSLQPAAASTMTHSRQFVNIRPANGRQFVSTQAGNGRQFVSTQAGTNGRQFVSTQAGTASASANQYYGVPAQSMATWSVASSQGLPYYAAPSFASTVASVNFYGQAGPLGGFGGLFGIEEAGPSLEEVVHSSEQQQPDLRVAAVIVTITDHASYDGLFRMVPQVAGEGLRVAVYSAGFETLQYLTKRLTNRAEGEPQVLQETMDKLFHDISSVDAEAVVFNWECCAGHCCGAICHESTIPLVEAVLTHKHMVMFSDHSLQSLIRHWQEEVLGPNPFVELGTCSRDMVLRFRPDVLSKCPSAQLQKAGELCNEGKAVVHAMGGTLVYSVDSEKADNDTYDLEVLTVVTHTDGQLVSVEAGKECKVDTITVQRRPKRRSKGVPCVPKASQVGFIGSLFSVEETYKGSAGHVLLTYASGGRLLASAGHWLELSQLGTTEQRLLEVATSTYGVVYAENLRTQLASCTTEEARGQLVQGSASMVVQQSAPTTYSTSVAAPGAAGPLRRVAW